MSCNYCSDCIEIFEILSDEIDSLRCEIEYLKSLDPKAKVGRKKKFTSDEEKNIFYLRQQGLSYRAISEKMSCSVGLVYNTVNKGKMKDMGKD